MLLGQVIQINILGLLRMPCKYEGLVSNGYSLLGPLSHANLYILLTLVIMY